VPEHGSCAYLAVFKSLSVSLYILEYFSFLMDLEARTSLMLSDNAEFGIAASTYIAASACDYMLTVAGLMDKSFVELNPIMNSYIRHFGIQDGLFVAKSLICSAVLSLCCAVEYYNRLGKTFHRAKDFLYPGSVVTALTGTGLVHGSLYDAYSWLGSL
jgi:hypothetical protein